VLHGCGWQARGALTDPAASRFGKITEDKAQTVRNPYFATAHAVAEENAKSGGPLMGTLFWHWCACCVRALLPMLLPDAAALQVRRGHGPGPVRWCVIPSWR
jgi:hypothetical protein